MLIGLGIRDVVLIETLDLSIGPGLTALTGETGAGKSIILDALGLALGARADSTLVRRGAIQASAAAIFALAPDHAVWALLDGRGLGYDPAEDLVLRRVLGADGRSRAFVNDQSTSITTLKEIGAALIEVHGQHETVGLLDSRTHRLLLDAFGRLDTGACQAAWSRWRSALETLEALRAVADRAASDTEELTRWLSELDRLDPCEGEETELAQQRAILGAAEKALADIAAARDGLNGDSLGGRISGAFRALQRAREAALRAGADTESSGVARLNAACEAVDRAGVEIAEATAAIDAAAEAFDVRPDVLEQAEERLFALRAMARKLSTTVAALPGLRLSYAAALEAAQGSGESLKAAEKAADAAWQAYLDASLTLAAERRAAGDRLAMAVAAELEPLKLASARFRVSVEPLDETRAGPSGKDRVAFEISTNAGAPFGELGQIASGGELARLSLALKAALTRRGRPQPLMIFDEVDQGVGGAVADAVGLRLKRLAASAQVLVVTHSPQVAARAEQQWKVSKAGEGSAVRTAVSVLSPAEREEEIARMLSGAHVTDEARAAARALISA